MAGILDELFGGGRGQGFEDLEAQLRQAQGAIGKGEGFLDPFRKGGLGALSQLQQMFGESPEDIINRIQGQYQETPGFQFQRKRAQEALQNQLAAAGLGGSAEAIQRSGQLASNLAQTGQQQNLQNVLGQRQQQMGGLENILGTGFGAAGQEAGLQKSMADLFGQIGQAQFGGDVSQSQALSGLFGALGQGAGMMFGMPGMGGMGGGLSGLFGGGGGGSPLGGFGTQFRSPTPGVRTPWINPGQVAA
jgi:hypothetical protein